MRRSGCQGFTMTELMITVVVVAVVMSVAVPQYTRTSEVQRQTRAQNTLRLIRQAEQVYHSIYGTYTSTLTNLTTLQSPGTLDGDFAYTVPTATATQLLISATRSNSSSPYYSACAMSIDAAGTLSGCGMTTSSSPSPSGGSGGSGATDPPVQDLPPGGGASSSGM